MSTPNNNAKKPPVRSAKPATNTAAKPAAEKPAAVENKPSATPASKPVVAKKVTAAPAAKPSPAPKVELAVKAAPTKAVAPVETEVETVAVVEAVEKKKKKTKVVRDSFTMPKDDYDLIDVLKEKALGLNVSIKKSELLRAGLIALNKLNGDQLKAALAAVEIVKTGRPGK
ncbi:hypothetical protein LIN78_15130 [Leeia sp. TBRC 13508]|uniref:Histone H1 n=1 Tax=Leeia speluncae TaxID=2884804 RepID=A0ABS8D9J8_9NEIS|nr:hypothetical protein [Leeia speluncae]MCB6184880.1 hypothetical protein [Leeia speluncae]